MIFVTSVVLYFWMRVCYENWQTPIEIQTVGLRGASPLDYGQQEKKG